MSSNSKLACASKSRLDTEQLTGLPRTLPPAVQKLLYLVVKVNDVRKNPAWRQPGMCLSERGPSFIDVTDRPVRSVAGNDPC